MLNVLSKFQKKTIIFVIIFLSFFLIKSGSFASGFFDYNYQDISLFEFENNYNDFYTFSNVSWVGNESYQKTGTNYSARQTLSDYITIANNPFLSNTEELNISFDFKADDWTGVNYLLDKAFQYTFYTSGGGYQFIVYGATTSCSIIGSWLAYAGWHNFNLIFDTKNIYVFIDNSFSGYGACAIGKIPYSAVPLTFSSWIGNTGNLDNLIIRRSADFTSISWFFIAAWWILIGLAILTLAVWPLLYLFKKMFPKHL